MRRAAWLLAAIALALPAAAQDSSTLPEGCSALPDGFLCEWDFDSTATGASSVPPPNSFSVEIPVRAVMLATVTVRMEGRGDLGWSVAVVRFANVTGNESIQYSRSSHNAPGDAGDFHTSTSVFLVQEHPLAESVHYLGLVTGYVEANEFAVTNQMSAPGAYHVIYEAHTLPAGDPPGRPAATVDDPQVSDVAHDARREEYDLLAAWLDDARVGDGLFDAHLRVANMTDVLLPRTPDGAQGYVIWSVPLTVADKAYEMRWFAGPGDSGEVELGCNFRRAEGQANPVVGFPSCEFERSNATMHAIVPEGFLGTPGAGEPIVVGLATTKTSSGFVDNTVEDEASSKRYDFALGGPDVWSDLNPRLDPIVTKAAWYQDPLASDNIPDTLSVAGALLATATFLAGLVVVQRNRRRTREILERIDALVRAHDADHRAALRALGDLERDFDRLYRDRRINEAQYQLAQQRIVAAASRLALRKELGLDDGTPG